MFSLVRGLQLNPLLTRSLSASEHLDVSVHGSGLRRPDQSLQLRTAVVLGLGCQLLDVHVTSEQVEASHLVGVDVQDLNAALLIGQTWRSGRDRALRTHGRRRLKGGAKDEKRHSPISIFTSNLPGLMRASSIRSGLLVIPTDKDKINLYLA